MGIIKTRPQPTFKYFYLGAIILFIGMVNLFYSIYFLSIILSITGIFLLLSMKGILIDPIEKKIKTYYNFFFFKFGDWVQLSEFTHVVFGPNSSSQVLGTFANSMFRTNSYSVSLLDKNQKAHELQEFTDYKDAINYFESISKEIGLPVINKQELMQKRAIEKRKYRK